MTKKKIMVAMSGGVDSSVAAALLLRDGWDVAGATMKLWGGSDEFPAAVDAAEVAKALNIPHFVFDFEELFQENVISPFINEYKQGRTPNPCVMCNKTMKFGAFLEKSQELGYDYIATGHYANIEYSKEKGRWIIKKSKVPGKDQSYVLYNLNQETLPRIILPVGNFEKSQVRELSREFGLHISAKPDSQDICFIPDGDYAAFIESRGHFMKSGDFVDLSGNILGKHRGLLHYTVGQRKGLGLALPEPHFVIRLDVDKNQVVLGLNEACRSASLVAERVNYTSAPPEGETRLCVKIRYSGTEVPALVRPLENHRAEVIFDAPERAVTPGQSVVFYDGDEVVGGGVISY